LNTVEIALSLASPPTSPPTSPPYGPPISLELARQVAASAEALARAKGWKMCIAVVNSSGHLVVFHKMDDVHYASIAVAQAKALTAVNFKRPTKVFEDAIAAGGAGLRLLSIEGLCPMEGGIPLLQDGAVIGAIGVSGVQSLEDGQAAQAGADMVQPNSGAIASA
jgi:glc operon protein GlcG